MEPVAKRVIICEDDPGIIDVVVLALSHGGHVGIPVPDPDAAIAAVREQRPDIVLLDLSLGGDDGTRYISGLREAHESVRIVLMSAHSNLPEIAARHGVEHLAKPFGLDDLSKAIERGSF